MLLIRNVQYVLVTTPQHIDRKTSHCNRYTGIHFMHIGFRNSFAINDRNQPASYYLQVFAFREENCCILFQTNAYTLRIGDDGLCHAINTASSDKMRIDGYVTHKLQTSSDIYVTF